MRVRLAFQQAVDERFLVIWESLRGSFTAGQGSFSVVAFDDENDFIQQVVLAELCHEDTVTLVAGVLLMLSRRSHPGHWISLTLTPQQLKRLRLRAPAGAHTDASAAIRSEGADLHNVMMQTPTPFVVLTGPEHRFAFMNSAYGELLRRPGPESVLGKTVREVWPELVGQSVLRLLDDVYRTGVEHIGRDNPAQLRNPLTGVLEQHYFNFIYYPVRDGDGNVCGIMAQATDVTGNVLERQVVESREEQLYKQWAELDTIYRYSPMAMCLLDARDFRILRLNDFAAEQLGDHAENLIGRIVSDIVPGAAELMGLYRLVIKGEVIRNFEFTVELPPTSGVLRTWLLTLSPLFDDAGNVEMIESVGVEITDRLEANAPRPLSTALRNA
jgi:PAS domain S-box-containing protein